MKFTSSILLLASTCIVGTEAFSTRNNNAKSTTTSTTMLQAENSRRNFLAAAGVFGVSVLTAAPQPAEATYSAYTNREKDWQERLEKGEVKVSSARELRNQLREIVPQNSEGAKIFCPNGPSAAVSPLMENKCGDRQAIPSVYGRTEDVMGNSIPGFSGGYYGGNAATAAIASNPGVGGFPAYGSVPSRK